MFLIIKKDDGYPLPIKNAIDIIKKCLQINVSIEDFEILTQEEAFERIDEEIEKIEANRDEGIEDSLYITIVSEEVVYDVYDRDDGESLFFEIIDAQSGKWIESGDCYIENIKDKIVELSQ